eukprot:Awhi_evm1s2371
MKRHHLKEKQHRSGRVHYDEGGEPNERSSALVHGTTGVELSNNSLKNEDCGSVLGLVIRDVVHQNTKSKPEIDRNHPERLTKEDRVQRLIEAFSQLPALRKEVEKAAGCHTEIENNFKMTEGKVKSLIYHVAITKLKPFDRILVNDSKSKILVDEKTVTTDEMKEVCALVKSKAIKYDKDFAGRKEKTPRPQLDRKKQGKQFLCKTCKPPGSTSGNRLHTADCKWVNKNSKNAAEQNEDKITLDLNTHNPRFLNELLDKSTPVVTELPQDDEHTYFW